MKRLRIVAKECNYQELDRWVNKQFIHGINDDSMVKEISCELKAVRNINKVKSDWVLMLESEKRLRGHKEQPGASQKGMSKLIPCNQKSRKSKQAHAGILVLPTHLEDAQWIGTDVGTVSR